MTPLSTPASPPDSCARGTASLAVLPLTRSPVVNLRCTAKLLKKLKEKPLADPAPPDNRLGDWYANVLNIGYNRLVLVTSERSLLSLVVPIKDSGRLRERVRERAHALLFKLGVPPALAAAEVRGMDRMPFAKTANRSVLASMNDFAFHAKVAFEVEFEDEVVYLDDVERYLAGIPSGALQYRMPGEEVRRLFGLT